MTETPKFSLRRLACWSADSLDLILLTGQNLLNQISC